MFRKSSWVALMQGVPPFRFINLYRDVETAQRAAFHFGEVCRLFEAETAEEAQQYAFQLAMNCRKLR